MYLSIVKLLTLKKQLFFNCLKPAMVAANQRGLLYIPLLTDFYTVFVI